MSGAEIGMLVAIVVLLVLLSLLAIAETGINRISRVECGSRFDIQTRRDNAEAELYTGQAITPPEGYVDPVQEDPGAIPEGP